MGYRHGWMIVALVCMVVIGGCQGESQPGRQETSSTSTPAAPKPAGAATRQALRGPVNLPQQADELHDLVPPKRPPQEITLVSVPVIEAPTIDGIGDETVWATAPVVTTLDYSSQREITLQSVYTGDMVFFLVTFPDKTASETHKTWVWDAKEDIYREGPDREDVFLFKWSMSGNAVSMVLREPEPHRADIWFWKAYRSNPAGYADDKWQAFTYEPSESARSIQSPKYGTLYFLRQGDTGEPAYEEKYYYEYQGDTISKYQPRQPTGSRGDVRAKGKWREGQWTIELSRKLDTGSDDDVQFVPGRAFLFGVACYAIAYDTPHGVWSQPLYRTGDVFDRLFFTMASRNSQ